MPKITVLGYRQVDCTAKCPLGHIEVNLTLGYSKSHEREFVTKDATKTIRKAWDERITEEKVLINAIKKPKKAKKTKKVVKPKKAGKK